MTSSESNTGNLKSNLAHTVRALAIRIAASATLLVTCSLCLAESDLTRLIPPDAPVLAGMRRMPPDQSNDVLWLATKNNAGDLKQLVALTEGDPERRFDRVIVSDSASNTDSLGSHLLLANGRFSFDNISTFAVAAGATKTAYKGMSILVLEPPAMGSPGSRWLAVPQPDIALLGSPSAVQSALDRYLSHTPADPRIVQRLQNLPEHNVAWSSIEANSRAVESHLNLHGSIGSDVACLRHLRSLGLGIRIGLTVKIDLRADSDSTEIEDAAVGCLRTALFRNSAAPMMRVTLSGDKQHALQVSLSRTEYDRWLNVFQRKMIDQVLEAMIPTQDDSSSKSASLPRVP